MMFHRLKSSEAVCVNTPNFMKYVNANNTKKYTSTKRRANENASHKIEDSSNISHKSDWNVARIDPVFPTAVTGGHLKSWMFDVYNHHKISTLSDISRTWYVHTAYLDILSNNTVY